MIIQMCVRFNGNEWNENRRFEVWTSHNFSPFLRDLYSSHTMRKPDYDIGTNNGIDQPARSVSLMLQFLHITV